MRVDLLRVVPGCAGGFGGSVNDPIPARVVALEALLVEKGIVDPRTVNEVAEHYETTRAKKKKWTDPAYRQRLLRDGTEAIGQLRFGGPEAQMVIAVENTPTVHNVVVCTLYARATRGRCSACRQPGTSRPPTVRAWWPSPERCSPRWDSTYLPEVLIRVWEDGGRPLPHPARTTLRHEGFDEAELARLVTRDSMIGVGQARSPGEGDGWTPTWAARSLPPAPTEKSSSMRPGSGGCSASPWRCAVPTMRLGNVSPRG